MNKQNLTANAHNHQKKAYRPLPYFSTILLCASLTGCISMRVGTQKHFQKQTNKQRLLQRKNITHWSIHGALSIQQPQKKPVLATYQWRQNGARHYQLKIAAPLNAVVISIIGKPGLITMTQSGQPTQTARSANALIQKQLGWRLPISNLYYWLRALPAPGQSKTSYDPYGHITKIQQQAWTIRYSNYQTIGSIDLPRLLQLHLGRIKLKIVIKQWTLT